MAQKTSSQDSKVLGLAGIMLAFLALSMNLLPMTGGPAVATTIGNTDNESRPTPCQPGYFVTSVNETNTPTNGTIVISCNSPSLMAKLTGQIGTVASIISIMSFNANSIYTIGGDVDVTAFTSGTITLQVTYTDWNSVTQTITIDTAAVLGDFPGNSETILVKASTTITIKTIGTFVATYNVGTWVFFVG